MTASRKELRTFRDKRVEAVKQYVGNHWSDSGASKRVPVNLMELAVNIYTRQLAARCPQVMATAKNPALKPGAARLQLAVNHLLKEIDFERTLQRCVLDAMFGMGILKVGISRAISKQVEVEGFLHDIGQPFADCIDLDNWVHDVDATVYEQVSFAGSRHRLPLEYVKSSPLFKNTDNLVAMTNRGEEDGSDRVESVARGERGIGDSYQDMVEIWDLWLPREQLVVTLADKGSTEPLQIIEWDGPEHGPFHLLGFSDVPGSVLPLPPRAVWEDMHATANILYRKLTSQAQRQKTVYGVKRGRQEDGQRVQKAADGDLFTMDDPTSVKAIVYPGADQATLAMAMHVLDKFSYFAGNLDVLGGLGNSSPTLGQDQLLGASASKRIGAMQDRTVSLAKNVIRDLAVYLWNDPLIDLPLTYRTEGTTIDIPMRFSAENREGDFVDYNIDLSPYSMQTQSPGEQLATITQVFQQFLVPFAQALPSLGLQINFPGLLRVISQLTNLRFLDEIVTFTTPQTDQEIVGESPRVQFKRTENVRVNRSTATRSGKDNVLMNALAGAGSQPDEMAALSRPAE